jgi:hypothetical protein
MVLAANNRGGRSVPTLVSGLGKILLVTFLIVLPYIGIFAYLLTQGGSMAQRNEEQARRSRDELRQFVGYGVADEIVKLDKLKSITEQEYSRLRTRLVQQIGWASGMAQCAACSSSLSHGQSLP